MKDQKRKVQNIHNCSGAIIPIFVVMMGSIIAVMFSLYINSILINRNSNLFRAVTKNICKNLSSSYSFNDEDRIISAFAEAVNVNFNTAHPIFGGSNFKLIEANLLLPRIADNSNFGYVTRANHKIQPIRGNEIINCGTGINWFGSNNCKLLRHVSSVISGDYPWAGSGSGTQVQPHNSVRQEENAKNTIGCYFKGQFKGKKFTISGDNESVVGENIPVVANYSFWRPIRGKFSGHLSSNPDHYNNYSTVPGIVLAVSTNMVTNSASEQFNWSQSLNANLASIFYPNKSDANIFGSIDPPLGVITDLTREPAPGHSLLVFPDPNSALSAGDREELIAACSNPISVARNTFLATFLQLAARHGQLRSSTEVLHVSPKHSTGTPNFPVKMVRFGTDLLRSYNNITITSSPLQLPYIYHLSLPTNEPVNPFGGSSQNYHAVVASQLRACAHMYKSGNGYIKLPHANLYNKTYESIDYTDIYTSSSPSYSDMSAFQSAMTALDQNFPWDTNNDNSSVTIRGSVNTENAGVDAISLVGMLGSSQSCPYSIDGCVKGSNEMRPDFLAIVKYIQQDIPSLNSPGIFAFPSPTGSPAENPFTGKSANIDNTTLPLVLVTHHAPDAGEAGLIATELELAAQAGDTRPIIVVFMPYNQTELDNAGNLATAFRVGQANSNSLLFTLDPREPRLDANGAPDNSKNYCGNDGCSNVEFARYYLDLIRPGSSSTNFLSENESIIHRANFIFNTLTAHVTRKF